MHPGQLPYSVLMHGRFAADCVRVIDDPRERSTNAQLEALIEAEWLPRLGEAQREGRLLFNGELLRYVSHRIMDGGSQFELTKIKGVRMNFLMSLGHFTFTQTRSHSSP